MEESLEDQEMAEVEVTPSVNSLVEAFLAAFRLEDDAFLLDDGLVFVVEVDDKTFLRELAAKLVEFQRLSAKIACSTQHGCPRVTTPVHAGSLVPSFFHRYPTQTEWIAQHTHCSLRKK